MKLSIILVAAMFAINLVGSSPAWVRAADTKDKAAITSETFCMFTAVLPRRIA